MDTLPEEGAARKQLGIRHCPGGSIPRGAAFTGRLSVEKPFSATTFRLGLVRKIPAIDPWRRFHQISRHRRDAVRSRRELPVGCRRFRGACSGLCAGWRLFVGP